METPAAASGGGGAGYADSVDSSPRSRGGDSWDDPPLSSVAAPGRLRLMCSYGGRICPRPTDKSLCYLGGETRMVVVDRHSSLSELSAKLSRTLLGGRPFTLKYQLPNEDLDSLISIATDEDLENMIEEYDRILSALSVSSGGGATRSSRLRLFLFPSKPDTSPTSSIGSLLDDSKSETWFVDALNSAMGGMGIDGIPRGLSSDSASVNCLLGLEDDSSVHSRGGGTATAPSGLGLGAPQSERAEQLVLPHPDSSRKLARQGQDVHSVPDSPILDTSSSFGSASSVPSLSNLPPIRVRPDDRPSDRRIAGLDEHLAHMNLSSAAKAGRDGQRMDDDFKEPSGVTQPQAPPPIPLSASSSVMYISPSENPSRSFSSDDEKSDHGGFRKQAVQPPNPAQIEASMPDLGSRTTYSNVISDPKRQLPVPSVAAADSTSYQLQLPLVQPEQFQEQHLHPQLRQQQQPPPPPQQQQQQYIPTNSYYIQDPSTGGVIPAPPYFPVATQTIQQSPQAHIPMYYYPVRPSPAYNLGGLQPAPGDTNSVPSMGAMPVPRVAVKPDVPANLYRTAVPPPSATVQPPPPPLIHIGADQAHPYVAGMGYHVVQQHHLSQSPATIANYGYQFATTDNTRPQMYYSQAAPSIASPGQPVNSVAPADPKSS
ncbi:leucine-rich repeat extensin-like protein 2 [Zingiber officinale]|nr:leucine-rich repeat extensin-like protein 2 [Zingiber officinale]